MASFGDLNRVNTNIQSLDSQLSLNRINKQMSENQLKMSTGKRINRAEDDSAGFSIATKLRSRVSGLNQAMQNVGDAKSVLDIAESSYGSIIDSLVEMKELTTQAANDTLGDDERGFIGDQIREIGIDIDNIVDQTVYQDYELLKGNEETSTVGGNLTLDFQVGERESDTITAELRAVSTGGMFAEGTSAGGTVDDLGATSGAIKATAIFGEGGGLTFSTTADSADYRAFLSHVDDAITTMSEDVNDIGITQSSLSVREEALSQSISANESAKSRIMDTDFAKAQSEKVRLSILQQTATSSLAQANNGPQSVLGFLG
ncbi:flagellin [Fodinibius halophilus]|uniref:Flagellin n=1 Tax=Fodinibius halophilus TaxID=1736908 RepID=A0A6M1THQ4_9BACT|nr:flagellin [Fodinibius halophilus]NGP90274.1 flagellin [Fodinibius halophilus]